MPSRIPAYDPQLAQLVKSPPDGPEWVHELNGRERLILVDNMRNNRTNTSIAAFSTRAREGATVSVPMAWTELSSRLDPTSFTIESVPRRLERQKRDPWADYFRARRRLTPSAIAALRIIDL